MEEIDKKLQLERMKAIVKNDLLLIDEQLNEDMSIKSNRDFLVFLVKILGINVLKYVNNLSIMNNK